jgi:hypothetical protein
MPTLDGLSARISIAIQDARISIADNQVGIEFPRIRASIPRGDCTDITRRVMPEGFDIPAFEFGLGQRVQGAVSSLRELALNYDSNGIHFLVRPDYRVTLEQNLPVLGWKRIGTISGKVSIPGSIWFRLDNPGAALPEVEISYEIVPGDPDILNIPDWAETMFKSGGQSLRDTIRSSLTWKERIRPFGRFSGVSALEQVQIHEMSTSSDETWVHLDFSVAAQVEH